MKTNLTPYLGALLEAWHELRINRNRIMLSLVSVAAAVWAMSTVVAMGNIITSSVEKMSAQWNGVTGTITLNASPKEGVGESLDILRPDGTVDDTFSDAAMRTVDAVNADLWTRERVHQVQVVRPEDPPCDPNTDFTCFPPMMPQLYAVDPSWFTIFQKSIVHGRALAPGDGDRLMNPVVITENLWNQLGSPAISGHPTIFIKEFPSTRFTVVGVSKGKEQWEAPTVVTSYDTFINSRFQGQFSTPRLYITAPADAGPQARVVAGQILGAELEHSWTIDATVAEKDSAELRKQNAMITTVLAIVGGIVIALGALGLLTVSIVTIGNRVREIGIRRAMGASAQRIFISVFLESIVATTVAGIVGVILSIITVRQLPMESMLNLPVELGAVAYPFTAAILGVAVATFVGALAGIIPATIAVRVKPIDAIRF